jgi:tRNA U34 5-methylaminomethyl-2-thiouridine-forming methyltransferase MnmC
MRLVQTADNSVTLLNERFNESYHSQSEGALRETREKHVRPALRYAAASEKIRVLDICFGLGYNSLCAIDEFCGQIEIVSPEIDRELIAYLPNLPYPEELSRYRPIVEKLSSDQRYEDDRLNVEILIGDAAEITQKLEGGCDIIFQDPFSVNKNPQLWSDGFFADLYRLLKDTGVLTTYSASHLVRARMKNAGFLLYAHPFAPESGLRKGTIASKTPIKELERSRV